MSVVAPGTLKGYLQTGDFPTDIQFATLVDTLLAAGKGTYVPAIGAAVGEPKFIYGKWLVCVEDCAGPLDITKFVEPPKESAARFGLPRWQDGENIQVDIDPWAGLREHRLSVYEAVQDMLGVFYEPEVTPGWAAYWVKRVGGDGGFGKPWVQYGLYLAYDVVQSPVDGSLKQLLLPEGLPYYQSVDFAAEKAASAPFPRWVDWGTSGGGGYTPPGDTTKVLQGDGTAVAKTALPISTATQTALTAKADLVAGKVPASQLPSYVDDVLEYANLAAFPGTGAAGIIYTALDTNKIYRWATSVYVEISQGVQIDDASASGSTTYSSNKINTLVGAAGLPYKLAVLKATRTGGGPGDFSSIQVIYADPVFQNLTADNNPDGTMFIGFDAIDGKATTVTWSSTEASGYVTYGAFVSATTVSITSVQHTPQAVVDSDYIVEIRLYQ